MLRLKPAHEQPLLHIAPVTDRLEDDISWKSHPPEATYGDAEQFSQPPFGQRLAAGESLWGLRSLIVIVEDVPQFLS